ncbi:hypothetical protein HYFRA_00002511 [Hymenoscyphus fraxineus]|uniref:Uncharacterized protein n=1 Tax=Hymenoscyphus fraxineus TaxID=746836 RepID=A0A9N9LAJ9_9HELO|nr:hypothetical protein HYFRA_00002511 [Hymenoscyphus fraxineus]
MSFAFKEIFGAPRNRPRREALALALQFLVVGILTTIWPILALHPLAGGKRGYLLSGQASPRTGQFVTVRAWSVELSTSEIHMGTFWRGSIFLFWQVPSPGFAPEQMRRARRDWIRDDSRTLKYGTGLNGNTADAQHGFSVGTAPIKATVPVR